MSTPLSQLQDLLNTRPHKNMSDMVYEKISQLIQSGEFPEGYVFPNEAVLCEQLSIGRSTIREAYKALELAGYVTRTKRGTMVNSTSTILEATPLKAFVCNADEESFLEFRLMLEGQTAALAAERATPDEIQELRKLHTELVEIRFSRDYEQVAPLDRKFHNSIAAYTHNPLMIASMTAIAETCEMQTKEAFSDNDSVLDSLDHLISMHQGILDAIRNQSPSEAMTSMLNHIAGIGG